MPQKKRALCAIDAQISPLVPGGTETHTLLQINALSKHSNERFVVIGLKDHAHLLEPYVGENMEIIEYSKPYSWYQKDKSDRFNPGPLWGRLLAAPQPFRGWARRALRHYAHRQPLSPRAEALAKALGPLGRAVAPLYRLYYGYRHNEPVYLSQRENDAMLAASGAQVVHFPYPMRFETTLPMVYEPWGLPHYRVADTYTEDEIRWMDGLWRSGCEQAAVVITATRWVKQDIMNYYGIPSSKIAVLPRIPIFEDPTATDGPDDALGEVPDYFALFPSVTWPTKNHIGLLRGMARLRDRHGLKLNLVCTGRTAKPTYQLILKEIAALGLEDQVQFLGRLSRTRLNRLYKRANFLVHPSVFEGLGLPLVEALHFDLPIVASNAACIPEVLADAAILFDPNDPESIADALKTAMENPALLDDLRVRGRRRLKEFFPTHDGLAARFVAIYKTAAKLPLSQDERALMAEMTA